MIRTAVTALSQEKTIYEISYHWEKKRGTDMSEYSWVVKGKGPIHDPCGNSFNQYFIQKGLLRKRVHYRKTVRQISIWENKLTEGKT